MAIEADRTVTESSERRFKQRLAELGIVRSSVHRRKPGIPKDRQPIAVQGRPVSEEIVEARR
ncbi:MAG: hypothetical protein HY721_32945 [Planctomycetes bacterium]|nr:hypothetical protein [Planctomycetota bacterium]